MTGRIGKRTNSMRTAIGTLAQDEREDQFGNMEGEIVSFDPATQLAVIKPYLNKKDGDGNPLPAPDLEDVKVEFPFGASGGMTFPIRKGTRVKLSPNMRSTEEDGENNTTDTRSFSLSDMRATIVGGNKTDDSMQGFDPDNSHFRFSEDGGYGIRGSENGKMAMEGVTGELLDILATGFETLAAEVAVVSSGSSAGNWALKAQAKYAAIAAQIRGMKI